MSFSIEKLITVKIYCVKCRRKLDYHLPSTSDELFIGSALYECPNCKFIIRICEE